jgi:hypothetical protein
VEIRLQIGFLPLYGGDATVGGVSTWLRSGAVGYRLPLWNRSTSLEASLAHVSQNHNPYDRAPAFTFVGFMLRQSLRAGAATGLQPYLGAGVGRLRVDAEEITCLPPLCLAEGGPNFRDGTFTTLVTSIGLVVPLTTWGAVTGETRLFLPQGRRSDAGDSDNTRPEFAVGLMLRL